jgi:hypothetical protein
VIIVGDSHTVAVAQAAKIRKEAGVSGEVTFEIHRIGREKPGGKTIKGPSFEQIVEALRSTSADATLVSMVGGNQYNVLGMLVHPEPFDFLLDGDDPATLTPGARVIPASQIEAAFDHFLSGTLSKQNQELLHAFPGKIKLHVEPPPPKEDSDYIRKNAENYFQTGENINLKISPAPFRRRLWVAQSRALGRLCDRLGMTLIRAPEDSMDESGYLRREAYGADATHANTVYGEMLLRQLEQFMLLKAESESR